MKTKSTAEVEICTNEGKYLLSEIQGLKEGAIVTGMYDSETGAFDFQYNGLDAVLWIGKNARIVTDECYLKMKSIYPEALILFRCGDFYETKYHDSLVASNILGITRTRRMHEYDMYLAGFPYHALDTYLPKLIRSGCRVAIVDEPVKGAEKQVVETVNPK